MRKTFTPLLIILVLTFVLCYLIIGEIQKNRKSVAGDKEDSVAEQNFVPEEEMFVDDTVVLVDLDTKENKMKLRLITGGKIKTLDYDSTTVITNKYNEAIIAEELKIGEIVDVTIEKRSKLLKNVHVSEKAFTLSEVVKYDIDERKHIITVNDSNYGYSDDLLIFSKGKMVEFMDITDMDTLTIKGVGHTIASITIEYGHGYLRFLNDAYFVNGWLEVDDDIIMPITSEMLVPVAEGEHVVTVRNRGYAGSQSVYVERDKESNVDLSNIPVEEVAIGRVLFTLSPVYAQLYIDDEITDYEERVPLEFGIHKIRVEAAGYKTVYTNLKVLHDYSDVKIDLEEDKEASASSSSSTSKLPPSTSSSSSSSSSTEMHNISTSVEPQYQTVVSDVQKIHVDGPEGVEVYLDGNYIGIAPVSTTKVTGSHVLTLSKDGYQTKTYNVNIDNDGKDVTYSFSGLVEN